MTDLIKVAQNSAAPTSAAEHIKNKLLVSSYAIEKVVSPSDLELATRRMADLKGFLAEVEENRQTFKKPVLELGRAIDAAAKGLAAEVEAEYQRLAGLAADYQAAELERVREAERQRAAEMEKLNSAVQAELATAKSEDEKKAIKERAEQQMEMLGPQPVLAKPSGQCLREDWEIVVTDIWLLARAHPACVKIEPRMSEIRMLLNLGHKVAGVKAERVLKAGVIKQKAIEL